MKYTRNPKTTKKDNSHSASFKRRAMNRFHLDFSIGDVESQKTYNLELETNTEVKDQF